MPAPAWPSWSLGWCRLGRVANYAVTLTYTVEVLDAEQLSSAGAAVWNGSAGGWAVQADGDAVAEVAPSEVADVSLTPEASLALVAGQFALPSIPGARVVGMSADARPL